MSGPLRTLIDAATLASHLGDPGWVLVDCRFTLGAPASGEKHFDLSRIPGAVYAHLERDLAAPPGPSTGRHPLPEAATFARTLGRWGVRPGSQVAVYDDSFGAIAARLWWLLRWAGHDSVAMLDGGWPAWRRRQLPIEVGAPRPRAVESGEPYPVRPDPAAIADADFVDGIRGARDWRLLDARPEERYSGEREPIDRVAGHIPGSVPRTFEDNLDFAGTFLPAATLRADFLDALGGVAPENTVHTCGSGVTACHNQLAMAHAGLPYGKLYPGSWSEWITDPARPVARGMD